MSKNIKSCPSRKRHALVEVCKGEQTEQDGKALKKQKRAALFRLKTNGENALLDIPSEKRVPITLTDIQYLLLHSLLGKQNLSDSPRWYALEKCEGIKHTACFILEGVSVAHWEKYSDGFADTKNAFGDFIEILTPSVYNGSLVGELALVPLSEAEKESIIVQYGSINLALEARKDLMVMMRAMFPIGTDESEKTCFSSEDKFPRTQLILSAWQLIDQDYPVPLKGKLSHAYSDYVLTKNEYAPVTDLSPLFSIDCEMCTTNEGSELTRISVVNEKHEIIYESLVKPYNEITNYVTQYSGITKSILNNVTKRLEDVQNDLRVLLPSDAIIVGQSLNSDLHALKMMHPYIIDTSLVYNFAGARMWKPKLRTLAREFLNERIQESNSGHSPTEDALAAMKLVQLKLSKSLEFGDAVHTGRLRLKKQEVKVTETPVNLSIFNQMLEKKKSSLILGCDDIIGDYHTYLVQAKETVQAQLKKLKPKRIKLEPLDEADTVISRFTESVSNYNLTMAHLKLDTSEEVTLEKVKVINKWIKTIWDSLVTSTLCVILLGGTNSDNGLAMIKVKNT